MCLCVLDTNTINRKWWNYLRSDLPQLGILSQSFPKSFTEMWNYVTVTLILFICLHQVVSIPYIFTYFSHYVRSSCKLVYMSPNNIAAFCHPEYGYSHITSVHDNSHFTLYCKGKDLTLLGEKLKIRPCCMRKHLATLWRNNSLFVGSILCTQKSREKFRWWTKISVLCLCHVAITRDSVWKCQELQFLKGLVEIGSKSKWICILLR